MNPKLKQAISEIKAKNLSAGRELLLEILQSDPKNETAWLWLAFTFKNKAQREKALKRVLQINPYNETARRYLNPERQESKQAVHRVEQPLKEQPAKKKSNTLVTILALIILTCCGLYTLGQIFITSEGDNASNSPSNSNSTGPTSNIPEEYVDILGDWGCRSDRVGNMIFTGRVRNTHPDRTLEFVKLRVAVRDDAGNIVNTRDSYIDSDIVLPGSTSSFTIYVDNPSGEDSCVIVVESARFD